MALLPDEEPEWEPTEDDEFWCESKLGINEVRMMYDSICFYLSIWPGPPTRPPEDQQYLEHVRNRLFAAIMEYNLLHNVVEDGDS